jgi:hypothetical protein
MEVSVACAGYFAALMPLAGSVTLSIRKQIRMDSAPGGGPFSLRDDQFSVVNTPKGNEK